MIFTQLGERTFDFAQRKARSYTVVRKIHHTWSRRLRVSIQGVFSPRHPLTLS
jgi:hypothetical protein